MKGFILAAGFGERLRPITEHLPKPLVPVMNVPSICYALAVLRNAGIDRIICNLHYKPRAIMEFLKQVGGDSPVVFSHEQAILGTGGGVKHAEPLLDGDEFVLLNSDVIMDLDLRSMIDIHRNRGNDATLALYRHPDVSRIGPVAVDGDRVIDFKNFLQSGVASPYIYTGAAVLSPRIFGHLSEEFSSIVYTGYVALAKQGRIGFYEHRGLWLDIGGPESLLAANIDHDETIRAMAPLLAQLTDAMPVTIHHTATIHPGSRIERSVVGSGATIGAGAAVRGSLIMPGGRVAANDSIADSIVFGDTAIYRRNSAS